MLDPGLHRMLSFVVLIAYGEGESIMTNEINESLLSEITAFCEKHNLAEWRYGILFAGTHKLCPALRRGAGIRSTTAASVLARAAEYDAANPTPAQYPRRVRTPKLAA